jgi:hypothetical protein
MTSRHMAKIIVAPAMGAPTGDTATIPVVGTCRYAITVAWRIAASTTG